MYKKIIPNAEPAGKSQNYQQEIDIDLPETHPLYPTETASGLSTWQQSLCFLSSSSPAASKQQQN